MKFEIEFRFSKFDYGNPSEYKNLSTISEVI